MSRILSIYIVALCVSGLIVVRDSGVYGAVARPAPQYGDSAGVRTVEIQDPIFRMTAYRTPIPQGWAFEGILLRDPACGTAAGIAYRATSPDGLTGEQQLPTIGWHWSDDPSNVEAFRRWNCKIMMPMSATDFLKYIIPVVRPGATIVRIEPTTDAQQWDSMIQQSNQRAQQLGIGTRTSGGGMRARLEYSYHGHDLEDNLAARLTCTQQRIGAYGGAAHSSWDCSASVISIRAPKGQLNAAIPAVSAILSQGAYTNEWTQRTSQQLARDNQQVLSAIHAEGQATAAMLKNNHEQYMKEQQSRFDHSQQIDRDRSAAMHNTALAYTLYAGDEQLVRNPSSGEVSRVTSNYGNNGWQEQTSGKILMTDANDINPNLYLRGEWTQLENVNPTQP